MPRPDDELCLKPDDAELDVRQRRQGHEAVELGELHLKRGSPVAKGGLGNHEVKPLVTPVQQLLALHARKYGIVDVVRCGEEHRTLREAGACILGSLKYPRNSGGVEYPERAGLGVNFGKLLLVWPES